MPALVAAVLALAGCGGGGGGGGSESADPASTDTAEGAYAGTTTRSITVNSPAIDITNDLQLVILGDGQYWLVSSFRDSGILFPAGFITGQGTSSSGTFRSQDASDFSFSSPPTGTLVASYLARTRIDGRVTDSTGTVTFSASAMPGSSLDYARAALLSEVSGSWNVRDRQFSAGVLNITATGALSGSAGGCDFTGTLTPHPNGKNVFVSSVTFGADPCLVPGTTSTGIAFTTLLADGRRQLTVVGLIPSRTYASAWVGVR